LKKQWTVKIILTLLTIVLFCTNGWGEANNPLNHKIRIALFTGDGAHPRPQILDVLGNEPNMTVTEIDGDNIRAGDLKNFDVLFVPGGSAVKESKGIELEGRNQIRHFVEQGGLYIGVCAGSYLMSSSKPIYLGLLPIKTADPSHWKRGKEMLPVQFTNLGMQIFKPSEKVMTVLYHNGPVFEKTVDRGISVLATYRDEIVGKNGEPGVMVESPAMVLGHFGKGLVIGISPHPEATPGLEYIERNAILWMYQQHETVPVSP